MSKTLSRAHVYVGKNPTQPQVSYLIHAQKFYLDLPSDASQPKYLSTMIHRLKWGTDFDFVSPKQITNPRLCTHVYLHFCDLAYFPDHAHTSAFNLGYVRPDDLLVHHYRKSCNAKWRSDVKREKRRINKRCAKVDNAVTNNASVDSMRDDYMLRFQTKLNATVYPVLEMLSLLDVEID